MSIILICRTYIRVCSGSFQIFLQLTENAKIDVKPRFLTFPSKLVWQGSDLRRVCNISFDNYWESHEESFHPPP